MEYNSWVSSGEERWNFFPRRKMENSSPVSPPRAESKLDLVDIVLVVEVEDMEPIVIIHPGLVEAMEEKPPTPSTPRKLGR